MPLTRPMLGFKPDVGGQSSTSDRNPCGGSQTKRTCLPLRRVPPGCRWIGRRGKASDNCHYVTFGFPSAFARRCRWIGRPRVEPDGCGPAAAFMAPHRPDNRQGRSSFWCPRGTGDPAETSSAACFTLIPASLRTGRKQSPAPRGQAGAIPAHPEGGRRTRRASGCWHFGPRRSCQRTRCVACRWTG